MKWIARLDAIRKGLYEEILLLSHESNISPEFAERLPVLDRKYLVKQTLKILEKKKEAHEKASGKPGTVTLERDR